MFFENDHHWIGIESPSNAIMQRHVTKQWQNAYPTSLADPKGSLLQHCIFVLCESKVGVGSQWLFFCLILPVLKMTNLASNIIHMPKNASVSQRCKERSSTYLIIFQHTNAAHLSLSLTYNKIKNTLLFRGQKELPSWPCAVFCRFIWFGYQSVVKAREGGIECACM